MAVTIFSIIAVALYSGFRAGIRVWRAAEANMELHHSVRLSLGGMAKDLRNAVSYEEDSDADSEDVPEQAETEKAAELGLENLIETPDLAFVGKRDEIVFVALAAKLTDEGEFRKELAKVRYFLGTEGQLKRSVAFQGLGFEPEDMEPEGLIDGIEELSFEYSYEGEDEESPPIWKEQWENQEGVPLGVKVRLKVKKKEGIAADFAKTVFIPTGILGKEETLLSGER